MNVKQIKRNISEEEQLFRDLVATPYGSLIQSCLILNGIEWSPSFFNKQIKEAQFPFLEDEEFIKKTLEAVNLGYDLIENKPLALCKNEYNSIFCPFISSKDNGEVVLLPLFKDCTLLRSQELAMANDTYSIVDWSINH